MKKIIVAIVFCMLIVPVAFGKTLLRVNVYAFNMVVNHYFPSLSAEQRNTLFGKYSDMLAENNNSGISAKQSLDLCRSIGIDVKNQTGKSQCKNLFKDVVSIASVHPGYACDEKAATKFPAWVDATCENDLLRYPGDYIDGFLKNVLYAKFNTDFYCSEYIVPVSGNYRYFTCFADKQGITYTFKVNLDGSEHFPADSSVLCRMFNGVTTSYDRLNAECANVKCDVSSSPLAILSQKLYEEKNLSLQLSPYDIGCHMRLYDLEDELDGQLAHACWLFPKRHAEDYYAPTYFQLYYYDVADNKNVGSEYMDYGSLEATLDDVELLFRGVCSGEADLHDKQVECDSIEKNETRVNYGNAKVNCKHINDEFQGRPITIYLDVPENYSFETFSVYDEDGVPRITIFADALEEYLPPPPVPVLDDNIEIPADDLIVENIPLDLGDDDPLRVEYITPPEPVLDDNIEIPADDLIVENIPLDLGGNDSLQVEYITPPEPVLDDNIEIPEDDLIAENISLDLGDDDPLRVEYITSPEPIVAESVDVESVVEPVVVPEPQPGVSVVTPTPTPDKPVTPYSVPENKSGRNALIATAAVLGAVGTGFLIGGLVGGGDDDENRNANVPSLLDEQLNTLMNNANGVLGRVDNNIITLARLQTLSGTYAPIVNISGRAVIAVIYAGHYLPYYMDASAGRWVPLLGIGNVGGWFNTYPQNPTGITVIDQITNILNQQLLPNTVRQFIGINATGAQFPGAATGAYSIINAEFPNGVVQSNSGTMSSGDQQLYDNNYQRIKNLFVTAQLGGFFIV